MKQTNTYVILVLFSAVAVFSACVGGADKNPELAQNMGVIQAYVDAASRGDASYLDEYLGPNYVYHGPSGDLGREGFKAFHEMVLSAFPGLAFRIEDMKVDQVQQSQGRQT